MRKILLYTTLTRWDEPPRSRHQVANVLKKDNVIYFVERSRIGLPKVLVSQPEENVFIITPYHPLDYRVRYRTPHLNEMYHNWLLKKIKLIKINFEFIITFDHTSYKLHNFFDDVLYYCGDDFIGNSKYKLSFVNNYHSKIEEKLSRNATLVIVTSDYLLQRHKKFNNNTYFVALGAPVIGYVNKFSKSNAKTPKLGLVAYLNRRIPLDLLYELLKKFPIKLIGPASPGVIKKLSGMQYAQFLGIKKGTELYKELDEVDVCIAPYDENKINKGVTPNKLWQYMALGKPTVVTNIPNIREWNFDPGIIYRCNNVDFLQTIEKAFAEDSEELFEKRKQLAKVNSWENRVKEILELHDKASIK